MEEEDELWSGATWCDSSCIYYFCIYVFVTFKYVCALHKLLKIHLHITYTYSYSTFTFTFTFAFVPCEPCFVSVIRICLFGQQLSTFVCPVKCICSYSTSLSSMLGSMYTLLVYLCICICISCALLPMTASSVWQYFVILNSILNKSQVCPFLKQKTLIRTVEREFYLSSITLKFDCCLNSRQKL